MFERDYLVRMLVEFAASIRRAMQRARAEEDLDGACMTLESSISNATDLDGEVLLSLSPESIAQVMQVSDVDPRVVTYIAHSMKLESEYLIELNKKEKAELRIAQANALARAYDIDLDDDLPDV
ncbi:MAG: hypothetical protein Q4E88_04225 [Coriobacteriia bacterium]|nr:hypothetical protein [Coriobacteriia bacterium]